MNNFTFGQFYPADSFVHKMDARFKIFLSLLYVVFIFFVNSYFGYAVTAAFILLVVAASKVPLRVVFKSIKGILILEDAHLRSKNNLEPLLQRLFII